MPDLCLLQAYVSTSPFPVVIYRPSSTVNRNGSNNGDGHGQQSDKDHGFDLDELPEFINSAARNLVGDYPFARCVATSSQTSLKQTVDEIWKKHLVWSDESRLQALDQGDQLDKKTSPSRHGQQDTPAAPPPRVEVTLLQAVSMERATGQTKHHQTSGNLNNESPSRTDRPLSSSSSQPLSPHEVPSPLSIRGEGNLQIIKWAFSVLPLAPDPGAELQEQPECILVMTGIWAQPGSNELPDLHRTGTFPGSSGKGSVSSSRSGAPTKQPDQNGTSNATESMEDPSVSDDLDSVPEQLVRKARELNIRFPDRRVGPPSNYPLAPSSPRKRQTDTNKVENRVNPASNSDPAQGPTLTSPGLRSNGEPLESYYAAGDRPAGLSTKLDPDVLARMAETAPIGMVIANTNAKLIWVNDKWHEITGIPKGESLDSWIDRVAPEYMSLLLQTVGDLMETRAVSNMDFMWNDGTWANFTTQCDYDEDGVFVGLIGTLTDATRRKRAELNEIEALVKREAEARKAAEEVEQRNRELAEANVMNQKLQQQRNMLASMAELSPTGLTISKADGNIVWANKAFLAMHGLDDSTKGEWADTVVEEDASRLVDMWADCVQSGTPLKSRHRLKNGKTVIAEAIRDMTTTLSGGAPYIGSTNDITLQVEGESAIRRLSDQRVAEAEQRRKDAIHQKEQQALLVDCVSHELRNGINPILQSSLLIRHSLMLTEGSFSLALRNNGGTVTITEQNLRAIEEDIEACDAIIDSAHQMERVANDILGLAQIQLNQLDVTPVPFDLGSQLRGIHRMFQADCKAKDLNLSLVLGDSLKILGSKAMIKADPTRLQQTIVNLCSNAIKFTSLQAKREVTIKVDVNLKAPDEHEPIVPPPDPPSNALPDGHPVWLYVSVSDTGPGMTPHELSKLFKKFTQANTEVHTQMGGNGLGLFIAKQLCELQDGRIEAISTKQAPTGSVFRFFIRAASVVKPTEMIRSRSTPLFPTDDSKTGSMHILVVDDNEINRKTLSRQLKMYKHQVKMAGDGQETLEIIEANEAAGTPFDCILLDVNLPIMDGLQCTAYLRKSEIERRRSKPYWIVGCTGNARPEQIERALQAGMDTVITKPYRLPALLKAIIPPPIKATAMTPPLESV